VSQEYHVKMRNQVL